MIAKDLITHEMLTVRPDDSFMKALSCMDEMRVSHLAIVDEGHYIGLISEEDIYTGNRFEDELQTASASFSRPYVYDYQHIFDVFRVFSEHKLTLLPVLDDKDKYLGVISNNDLIHQFAEASALQNPGSVIVLELPYKDYSLAEITQIIESNDASILSVFITSLPDSSLIEVSIKINRLELSAILSTFNRYNYTVKASYGESSHVDVLKDRYDQLMTYLNI